MAQLCSHPGACPAEYLFCCVSLAIRKHLLLGVSERKGLHVTLWSQGTRTQPHLVADGISAMEVCVPRRWWQHREPRQGCQGTVTFYLLEATGLSHGHLGGPWTSGGHRKTIALFRHGLLLHMLPTCLTHSPMHSPSACSVHTQGCTLPWPCPDFPPNLKTFCGDALDF